MRPVTIPELAKKMGVNRVNIWRQVKLGEIIATRVGPIYLISNKEAVRVLDGELSERAKAEIHVAVKRLIKEHGWVLKKLGES